MSPGNNNNNKNNKKPIPNHLKYANLYANICDVFINSGANLSVLAVFSLLLGGVDIMRDIIIASLVTVAF